MIIDFHSHILPAIDDGSHDQQETIKMLSMMAEQQVDCVIATPHLYPDRMNVADFLKKRDQAYELILSHKEKEWPLIKCGAELAFFREIGKSGDLKKLCIGDTNLLLIEMPFRTWTEQDLRELDCIINKGITPILAHVERYYPYQRDRYVFYSILQLPLYIQINAEAFSTFKTRRIVDKILDCGKIILLGSDCHGTNRRTPNLSVGRNALRKKYGEEFLMEVDALGENLIHVKEVD